MIMFKKETITSLGITYEIYTYQNDHMMISFSQMGGTIIDWLTKNHRGEFESIILRYHDIEDFLENDKSLGATVGPYAGRIYPATIQLEHGTFDLDKNFMNHSCLHSSIDNIKFHKCDVKIINDHTISFQSNNPIKSKYPGHAVFTLIFEIKDNELIQTYQTTTKQDTYTNLTNHTYFNLSGNIKHDILDHILTIPANTYGELNDYFITTHLNNVNQTPFDFRQPKSVRETILSLKDTPIKGLDHPFVLEKGVITLHDPSSGRTLEMTTDQDAVVVYSNNFLTENTLYPNKKDRPHLAICLETQHYPNDIHFDQNPKSFHPKNTTHVQKTTYKITLQ
jgi:aldose 1-epimerase